MTPQLGATYMPRGAKRASHAWQVLAVPADHPRGLAGDPQVLARRIDTQPTDAAHGEQRMFPLEEFRKNMVLARCVVTFIPEESC